MTAVRERFKKVAENHVDAERYSGCSICGTHVIERNEYGAARIAAEREQINVRLSHFQSATFIQQQIHLMEKQLERLADIEQALNSVPQARE